MHSDALLNSLHEPSEVSGNANSWWLKLVLQSEVGGPVFSVHRTGAASSSASCIQGASINMILEEVRWKSANTFAKFYHKEHKQYKNMEYSILRVVHN